MSVCITQTLAFTLNFFANASTQLQTHGVCLSLSSFMTDTWKVKQTLGSFTKFYLPNEAQSSLSTQKKETFFYTKAKIILRQKGKTMMYPS
jgi:hypothetical protein